MIILLCSFRPHGKESTEVWITQYMERKGKLARKVMRSPVEYTQTQTHGNLRYFGDHQCLFRPEELIKKGIGDC